MTTFQNPSNKFDELRYLAETLLNYCPSDMSDMPIDVLELIHELKIHQAELEIQNEELQRAQQELSIIQQEYIELYEFAPCGYLTVNANGIITNANLKACCLLKTNKEYLLRSTLTHFILPDWEAIYLNARKLSTESGLTQSVELRFKNTDDLWIRVDIEPVQNINEKLWRLILIDITDNKKLEQEKLKLHSDMMQMQKMETIGVLAGGIAHDFNNILFIILGSSPESVDKLEK